MDYIGMNAPNGIIQIVLRTQRVVNTRRCSSVIILSVNAETQRLGIFNQINLNALILEKTQETKSVSPEQDTQQEVFTRAGYRKGKDGEEVYICRHNKRGEGQPSDIIRINENGIKMLCGEKLCLEEVPVRFENPGTMSELVSPVYEYNDEGKLDVPKTLAHLNDLRKYVNVSDEDFRLILAWLSIALYQNPNVDAPVLWIEGERNTGKTTASKILKGLVDPCTARMLSQYVSGNDFLDTLNSQYVSVIDNVSAITPKFNDMLCRTVTDEKNITVFTKEGVLYTRQHSNIIVNGLKTVSKTPELQERCFTVRTRPLTNEERMTNEELEVSFEQDAPYILGGLIVAVYLGLRNKAYKPHMRTYTRLLDAGQFVARVANAAEKRGLPFTEQDFMSALKAQKADQDAENAEALKEDMIAQAIYEIATEQPATSREVVVWDDNSELLREKIEKHLRGKNGGKTPEDFPATPQKFGRKLSAISELLSEVGIHIDRVRREGFKRYTRITYTPDTEPEQIADDKSPTPEATSNNEPHSASSAGSTYSAEKVSVREEAETEVANGR